MAGKIYVQQTNDATANLVAVEEQAYDTEDVLQQLLVRYPDLLAGEQISTEDPRRWLFVSREVPIRDEMGGAGRLDHLFLDQDGIPTFVEVKREDDTRIRREVVGQMLDYAANAVAYFPIETLQDIFGATCGANGLVSDQVLRLFLGDGGDIDSYWKTVKNNLASGRIRLLFVADVIPQRLRRIIEFLNEQMDPAEVLGVEIRQYVGPDLKTFVPRVVGQTAEAVLHKAAGRDYAHWDQSRVLEQMDKVLPPREAAVGRRIWDWAIARGLECPLGIGKEIGSFSPRLRHGGAEHRLMSVYSSGTVEVVFRWMRTPPFSELENRRELLNRLNAVPGISIPADKIDLRPSVLFSTLAVDDRIDIFLAAFDWAIERIKST
jgi:hypothetical protein